MDMGKAREYKQTKMDTITHTQAGWIIFLLVVIAFDVSSIASKLRKLVNNIEIK